MSLLRTTRGRRALMLLGGLSLFLYVTLIEPYSLGGGSGGVSGGMMGR